MRVLVTGGAGFIGSHFVGRLVERGAGIVVLDALRYSGNTANLPLDRVDFVHADIADYEAVRSAADGCAAIVNFAAETHVDRSIITAAELAKTEIDGTRNLLEVARELGSRLVQVSTDEVYGDLAGGGSSTERDALSPSSPYSWAKAASDLMIPAWVRTYGVDASLTRGSNTYGPNQYPEKLVPLFVTNALDGEPLPLYGDGRQVRDWMWVEDHCAAIELVLESGEPGEAYNVGANDERENVEVATRIVALTGADPSLVRHVDDRPGHDRRYSLDTSKLRALGWAPQKPFDQGLAETVAWYRDNRGWWEPIKSGDHYREYYERQYAERLA